MVVTVHAPSRASVLSDDLPENERKARQIELNRELVVLLQSWLEDDEESEEEQRAALEELKRGIDEHRTPGNKIFS